MRSQNRIILTVLIVLAAVAAAVFFYGQFSGRAPAGHEQAGEPNRSYQGLADVFNGKPGMEVSSGTVRIDEDGTSLSGFLSKPVEAGRYPGIVMIHEWWGLNDQVKSMADILAGEGYVVLAVDLFDGKVATTIPDAQDNIRNNPPEKTVPKMKAAVKYLRKLPDADPGKIASLGWCYGGGQSFLLGTSEDLQATVIYYGQVSADRTVLGGLKEPVIGFFGAEDASIPVPGVRDFENALKEQGTPVDIYIYDGAGHAFANPTNTQAFRKEQALDAWAKTLLFLKRNLKES